jgi:hypothetical protein
MAGVNTNTSTRQASINGLRGSFSNITWDGIGVNDNLVRTDSTFATAAPTVAGVAEFTLTTQNAGPDEGLGIAQIKLTTPRGGSSYHGQAYDYYRNSKFDANTFFNNATIDLKTGLGLPKPALLQHQYGFNVGGPFALPRFGEGGPRLTQKHKLFFYFFLENTNTTQEGSPLRTVLSAGARTGNFTYLRTDNGQPQTVNVLTLGGRTIDPTIKAVIDLTPASNNNDRGDTRNTQGFRFNTPDGRVNKIWGFRVDYDVNSSNRIEAIFDRNTLVFPNDFGTNDIGEVFPGLLGGGQDSQKPRAAFAWHSSPTSTITNEARFGFLRSNPRFFNNEKFTSGYRLSLPLMTNPVQTFLPQGRVPTNFDWIDNVTWVKGNHVIRFGGQYRAVRILNYNDVGIVPLYTVNFNTTTNPAPASFANNTTNFTGGISATEFTNASSLLGLLSGAVSQGTQTFNVKDQTSGFTAGVGSNRHLDYNTMAFYGGDTWRFRSNLSINLGLRWEYIGSVTERDGLALLPTDTSLAVLNDPKAVLDFAGAGTKRPLLAKDLNNFAPNVSFAWDPLNDGKTSLRGGFAVSYAIDNNATVLNNAAVAGNAGLSSTVTNSSLTGTVSGGGIIKLATPVFKVPRTLEENLALSQAPTLFTTDFHLKTPYAQQWNLGIEREIWKDTGVSIGYVGNHGLQLTRGIDANQVVIFQNGFLNDFLRGQGNLTSVRAARAAINADTTTTAAQKTALLNARPVSAAFNTLVPGSTALTIFPRLGSGGNLANSTIVGLFDTGQVGELASNYISNRCTYLIQNPLSACPTANTATLGSGFFLNANSTALGADYVGSGASSNYHGLQAEIRKRLSHGYYYQINYTWSKAFTNSDQSQAEFGGLLDLTIGDPLEKKLINQDVRHVLKGNAVYELPFGPGRRFLNSGGVSGKLLGGWQLGGLFAIRTGRPISFISGRGTVNRAARSGKETANSSLTGGQLRQMTGLFHDPVTGLPRLFDPALITAVLANISAPGSNTLLTNPNAGQFGNLGLTLATGPGYWNADVTLLKRTRISESMNFELRLDAFNVFNHTNFSVSEDNNVNSQDFGKITSTFSPRILQIAGKFNF